MKKEKTFEKYSDEDVIQKILDGEVALFEILIRRNNSFLYKTGRSYNYNHEDTQDLMQDTLIDAYSNLSKFESRSTFKPTRLRHKQNSYK
jgi:DNA-directed RNA polymerase specialized sigma24 family protein